MRYISTAAFWLTILSIFVGQTLVAQELQAPVVKKIKEGRFIDEWIVLGPMPLYEEDSVRRDVVQKFLFQHLFADTIITNPIVVGYSRYDWQKVRADNDGKVMLSKLYDTTDQLYSYSLCIVESKDSTMAVIGFGSDDDAEIWHNGNLIHQICRGRGISPEDDIIPVLLVPGRNIFLVRVDNRGSDWGFCFRFIDKQTEAKARSLREFDPYRKYAPLDLANDAALLQAHLVDLHPGYSRYISKKNLDAQFLSLQKDLALGDSLTIKEFLRKVLPVLALIRDAHTMLWPDEKYFINDYRFAPFELRLREGKLIVTKLFDAKLFKYQMSELIDINGLTAEEFLAEAQKIIPRDGSNQSFLSSGIANYGLLNLLCNLLFMDSDNLEMTVRLPDGQEDKLTLYNFSSCNARYVKPDVDAVREPISQNIDMELNYCYLAVNSFWLQWIDKAGVNYSKAIKSLFEKLEDEHVGNLIIDLRYNIGGNPEASNELLSYLLPDETVYLSGVRINKSLLLPKYLESDAIKELGGKTGYLKYFNKAWVHKMLFDQDGTQLILKEKFLENVATIEPSKYGYKGKIYVLIGGRTSDAASEFCSVLSKRSDVVFIGQETGGAQAGGCGGFYFPLRLPTTNCRIWIPAIQADLNTSPHELGRGLIPDYMVIPALLRPNPSEDPELLKARELIRASK